MEEHNNNQEFSFIKEKIKAKPINRRRVLGRILWVVSGGILFGLIACVTFVLAEPKLKQWMEPETDTTVNFPGDEVPEVKVPEKEEPTVQLPDQIPVYVEKNLEVADYQELLSKLYAIGKKGNRSVVTVTGVTSNLDWFDSAYESETQASGIIIANNGQELLILSEKRVIDKAEEISITFINDDEVPATLKKYDGNTGLAVLSVALSDISEETMGKIDVAVLGNSLTVNQGTVVIAIGSPLGSNYSILSGTVTSAGNTVSTWDSTYKVFTTDIMGSKKGSGVLINLNGEIVGIVMQEYSTENDPNTITALAVSQLKGVIEDLSNGKDMPYLGMKLSTVTEDIHQEFGLPLGVYIKNIATNDACPAMNAGLQEGDVIVEIDGQELLTVDAYTQKLLELSPEQQVKIKVLRQSAEDYVEVECTAVVGVLQ